MIETVRTQESQTAVVHEQVPVDQLPEFFGQVFTQVIAQLNAQGVGPAGPPFALFRGAPTEVVDVEAGFPVHEPIQAEGPVRPSTLPAGTAVQAIHVGPYGHVRSTYEQLREAIVRAGHTPAEFMWETYLNQPGEDPGDAETLVVWPFSD